MIQGSNMTRGHKGMRKGISLLELLIAIVLLGVLSSVGFKYYKVFYDTSFAAKQAKMYVIIEQAQQLLGSHQLFDTKNGLPPFALVDMVTDKQLRFEPPVMPEVSKSGWELHTHQLYDLFNNTVQTAPSDGNISLDITYVAATANDIAFILPLDGNNTTDQDKLDFCNIINNTAAREWRLDNVLGAFAVGAAGNEPFDFYNAAAVTGDTNVSADMFCYSADAGTSDGNLTLVFPVLVDTTN